MIDLLKFVGRKGKKKKWKNFVCHQLYICNFLLLKLCFNQKKLLRVSWKINTERLIKNDEFFWSSFSFFFFCYFIFKKLSKCMIKYVKTILSFFFLHWSLYIFFCWKWKKSSKIGSFFAFLFLKPFSIREGKIKITFFFLFRLQY